MYVPNVQEAAAGAGTLAGTGVFWLAEMGWLTLGFLVIGGAITAATHFAPRIAVEPIRQRDGKYRFTLTKNGQPWRSKGHG